MNEIKKKARYALAAVAPAVVSGALAITSHASEGETGVVTAVATSLVASVTEMATAICSVVGQVIPLALPVIGASLVVSVGVKVFKTIASKA